MEIKPDDFRKLAFSVHDFLARGDLKTRLATEAKLYLEFPDVGAMHDAHIAIRRAMLLDFLRTGNNEASRYIDDHTIVLEPYAGISVVLTCAQRFAVKSGGSVGYRDIIFKDAGQE